MKRILFVIAMITLLFVSPQVQAQTNQQNEKITVNASDLTVDQIAKIKAQQEIDMLQKKLDTYGNWIGVGGEIGKGIREALLAVVDVSEKFGTTKVGQFTMYMVAWKVMGKDVVRIFLGLLFALVSTIFIFYSYRKNFTTRRVKIKSNGLMFWKPCEYETVEPVRFEGVNLVKFFYPFILMICYWITYGLMFA